MKINKKNVIEGFFRRSIFGTIVGFGLCLWCIIIMAISKGINKDTQGTLIWCCVGYCGLSSINSFT
jgi:hypothetical protein